MRFTIRDLLWLTVVVALAVAWWVDRGRLAAQSAERDRLWKESLSDSLNNLGDGTGQEVWINTPDGEMIGWIPADSPRSQAFAPNPPKK